MTREERIAANLSFKSFVDSLAERVHVREFRTAKERRGYVMERKDMKASLLTFAEQAVAGLTKKDVVSLEAVYDSLRETHSSAAMYKVDGLTDWAWKLLEKSERAAKEQDQLRREMAGLASSAKAIAGEL